MDSSDKSVFGIGHSSTDPFNNRELIDPHNIRGEPFVFPGIDGLPFRGSQIPHLKEDDPEYKRPTYAVEVHVARLDMNKEEDVEKYAKIYQLVVNQYAIIGYEKIIDQPGAFPKIFIRWYLVFFCMPKNK